MLGSLLPGALSTTPPRPTRPFWSSDLVDRARIYAGRMQEGHSNRAHPRRPAGRRLFPSFSTPHSTVRDLIRHKVRDQNQRLRTDLR
ncbi:hypothetical protein FB107DRAFT_257613 [Schizophyllum commune]